MPQMMIGTSAHEGPMAMMALHPELDHNLPMSSLLWTVLFWGITSNHTILPDAFGSASFKAMLHDTGLLHHVTMARQDSGHLSRFTEIYPSCLRMASEIENFKDVMDALALGYVAFGAGGFFGEKRRSLTEFSLAAKLTKARRSDGSDGFAGKLGDFGAAPSGSWADYDPASHEAKAKAKFIVSAEADREAMWAQMLSYATRGDVAHDRATKSGLPPPPLLTSDDVCTFAAELKRLLSSPTLTRFEDMASRLTALLRDVEAAGAKLPRAAGSGGGEGCGLSS